MLAIHTLTFLAKFSKICSVLLKILQIGIEKFYQYLQLKMSSPSNSHPRSMDPLYPDFCIYRHVVISIRSGCHRLVCQCCIKRESCNFSMSYLPRANKSSSTRVIIHHNNMPVHAACLDQLHSMSLKVRLHDAIKLHAQCVCVCCVNEPLQRNLTLYLYMQFCHMYADTLISKILFYYWVSAQSYFLHSIRHGNFEFQLSVALYYRLENQ